MLSNAYATATTSWTTSNACCTNIEYKTVYKDKPTLKFKDWKEVDKNIEKVIFHDPATIVYWKDGTKTVVKCQSVSDKFDKEKGFAMAICKHLMGDIGSYNKLFDKYGANLYDDEQTV